MLEDMVEFLDDLKELLEEDIDLKEMFPDSMYNNLVRLVEGNNDEDDV